jgi:hypothetical protein
MNPAAAARPMAALGRGIPAGTPAARPLLRLAPH